MKKRILSFAGLLLTAVLTLSLTSCDKDYEEANYLEGVWQGYISKDYYYSRYTYSENWVTEIQFYRRDAYGGTGREMDYDDYTGIYNYITFDWEVNHGNVYLYYNDGSSFQIWNYRLHDGYFYGELHDRYGDYIADFQLVKVGNWYSYNNGWRTWDDWYYSKEQKQVVEGEE